jgi:hypothetical protein
MDLHVTVLLYGRQHSKLPINNQYYYIKICLLFCICFMFRSSWIIIRQFSWYTSNYWIVLCWRPH